ncbi:MAG: TetR/AcrR family transcriptional regulator [Ruminococcus sp.]|nr:TetR/AcrR family transcriptional regulator [Ruminococcus sp.]
MDNENESREKLIVCAKKEFMEKGFEKASLRAISSAAGLTTGAVYFFFKDKNGLFGAVVDEPLKRIINAIDQHFSEDMETDIADFQHTSGDHDEFAELMISALYADREAMMILLERASGSHYEGIIDRFVEMIEKHNISLANNYIAAVPDKRVNEYMLHWFSHVQINAFVHLLTHVDDKERAAKEIKPVMDMLVETWLKYVIE